MSDDQARSHSPGDRADNGTPGDQAPTEGQGAEGVFGERLLSYMDQKFEQQMDLIKAQKK